MRSASPLDTVSKADNLSKNLSKCFGKQLRARFIGVKQEKRLTPYAAPGARA